jgi:hypothetical protein
LAVGQLLKLAKAAKTSSAFMLTPGRFRNAPKQLACWPAERRFKIAVLLLIYLFD